MPPCRRTRPQERFKLGVLTLEKALSCGDFIKAAREDSCPFYVGHFCCGAAGAFCVLAVYVTCLRDPVERSVSCYRLGVTRRRYPGRFSIGSARTLGPAMAW